MCDITRHKLQEYSASSSGTRFSSSSFDIGKCCCNDAYSIGCSLLDILGTEFKSREAVTDK
jgi:hypothetical protein